MIKATDKTGISWTNVYRSALIAFASLCLIVTSSGQDINDLKLKDYRPRLSKREMQFLLYLNDLTIAHIHFLRRMRGELRHRIRRLSNEIGSGIISVDRVHRMHACILISEPIILYC